MSADPESDFQHHFVPGTSARTLILLHGTGGNENSLLSLGKALDPTAALLSPRGQVLENGMPRFFRRLAEGIFDEADLIRRTHELADFLLTAAAHYGFIGVINAHETDPSDRLTLQDAAAMGFTPGHRPVVGKVKTAAARAEQAVVEGVADVMSDDEADSDYSESD